MLPFTLFLALVANALDALFTIYWTRLGVAEANPVMAAVLGAGEAPFLAVKLVGVSSLVLLLWKCRHLLLARFGLYASASAYGLVLFLHLFMFAHYF